MLKSNMSSQNVAEIVFFDLETTVPRKAGARIWVLEFGAIVVCPQKLEELESYCTLIRPTDLSVVNLKSGRVDGITRGAVRTAPKFEDVADRIFGLLDGKVWAGHNIHRFDCPRIREAFVAIGRAPPVPVGTIDSLGILAQKFGRRAGNMKVTTTLIIKKRNDTTSFRILKMLLPTVPLYRII
ncbi:protein NEN4-like [Papaver somniferum]|uniref:protein NEN4-like n=1 Tax=Papaver somniferum TaxID=3469 RepID=UPI000E6F5DC3|nr:protein NEN4-like [Papaver somniferum]XP_026444478.1 protein NEN4-like [Papaver somniferum]